MVIWKFEIEISDGQVQMPFGAQILCVQMQNGVPCLWAMVDKTAPYRTRKIVWYGTGQEVRERLSPRSDCSYIGTVQMAGGALVFHCFDGGWGE